MAIQEESDHLKSGTLRNNHHLHPTFVRTSKDPENEATMKFPHFSAKGGKKSKPGRFDVAEIFSPPRTCLRAQKRGLRGGWSMDNAIKCHMTGRTWDLLTAIDQKSAKRLLQKDKPALLIASPPCTAFSILQNFNKPVKDEVLRNAIKMVDFSAEMCLLQHKSGRKFVFEHPVSSRAWSLPSVKKLAELEGMYAVSFDQCMFGQAAVDKEGVEGW